MKASLENWSNSIKLLAISLLLCAPLCAEEVNSIVAKVGDASITAVELDRLIPPTLKSYAKMMPNDEEIRSEYRKERVAALKSLIDTKLLVKEADKLEVKIPPIEIDKQLNKERERFASEEEFQAFLKENKITLLEFRQHLSDAIKAQAVLQEKVFKRVRVLPHEVHKFYTENKNLIYTRQPSVHLYQILIKDKNEEGKPDPETRIRDVRSQLAQGANFQRMALMYSEGPMKDSGGDWGLIEQGHFGEEMAEVERAAFNLAPGQYSEVIKTPFGYHIVYVSAKQDAHVQTEREAYDDIYRRVAESKSASVYEPYMNGLRRSCSIEVFDPELMEAKPATRPGKKVGDFMTKPAAKTEAAEETVENVPAITPTPVETVESKPIELTEKTEVKAEEKVEEAAEKAEETSSAFDSPAVTETVETVEVKGSAFDVPESKPENVDPLKELDAQLDAKAADQNLPGAKPNPGAPVFEMQEIEVK